jgi:DNA-directed RNA polymerase alpha subunit
MAEVTREEFDELRTLMEKTYWMARGAVQSIQGKDWAAEFSDRVDEFCDPVNRRLRMGTPFYEAVKLPPVSYYTFWDADLLTLEDISDRSREEIAALPGVGRVSLSRIEDALAERGLSFAETC